VVTGLTWFYFVFYLVDFFLLSDSFLVATTHLVLFIAVVKLFSARSNRDYLWLALIGFLEILAAATLTVGTTFLIFFFLFLVFGVSTFVSYEIKRGTETAQTAPLPAGSVVGRRMERSLLGTSVTVAVATLLLASLFFFTLPRVTAGYMSAYGFQPGLPGRNRQHQEEPSGGHAGAGAGRRPPAARRTPLARGGAGRFHRRPLVHHLPLRPPPAAPGGQSVHHSPSRLAGLSVEPIVASAAGSLPGSAGADFDRHAVCGGGAA
jgi:hypothetical protein